MEHAAHRHGGRLLTPRVRTIHRPVQWQCRQGHQWATPYKYVKTGSWCPICQGMLPPGELLVRMRELAQSRGGELVSDAPANKKNQYRWRFGRGHVNGDASYLRVVNAGTWCPHCVIVRPARAKYEGDDPHEYAAQRGGTCLYKPPGWNEGLATWECGRGHVWQMKVSTGVVLNRWCSTCERDPTLRLAEAHEIAACHGGELVSQTYVRSRTPLKWKCYYGHMWDAKLSSLRRGTWCPECAKALIGRRQ